MSSRPRDPGGAPCGAAGAATTPAACASGRQMSLPLFVIQPDAEPRIRPERLTNRGRRSSGPARVRAVGDGGMAPERLEKQAAARPEEVRARLEIVRQPPLDR